MGDEQDGRRLDGNALAGPLREVFAVDVTAAIARCAGCSRVGVVAELRVYAHAPGLVTVYVQAPGAVARCPTCEEVVLRLVRGPDRVWLDLRGSMYLEAPLT